MASPNPTKRPFAPTLSAAEAFQSPSLDRPSSSFARTDSRMSCSFAAAPPTEVLAGLQSVGMRARMAVERGYEGAPTTSRHNSGASVLPPRNTWARTQSLPSWGTAVGTAAARELQPFGEGNGWPDAQAMGAYRAGVASSSIGSSFGGMDEDAESVASSSLKRTADDVLGDAFDDGDGDFVGEEQENTEPAPRHILSAPSQNRLGSSARMAPRANPFAQSSSTMHTMPANLATAEYLRAGDAPGAGNEPWASMRFDDYAKKEDF